MLSDRLGKVIIFAAGAAIGSLATWKLVKSKYERLANEEIRSVKETFARKQKAIQPASIDISEKSNVDWVKDKPPLNEYSKIINQEQYQKKEVYFVNKDEPYIIEPDDFDTLDYETMSLVYYADGVVEDDFENVLTEGEIEAAIGTSFADHFGEYEADSVFVRNDARRMDYEIMRDNARYSDIHPSEND